MEAEPPMTEPRRIARLRTCRVRRPDGGCPCATYCLADHENGCLPVRPVEPPETWQVRVEIMFGL